MAYKGKYIPKNPDKYRGDPSKVIYRSTWELRVMNYLDDNRNIIWWGSEEIFITYISPIDGMVHKYFPDFLFCVKDRSGGESIYMWEIKPYKQTIKPVAKRKTRRFIQEVATYEINRAKWEAAERFCRDNNWKFDVITEEDIFKRG